MPYVAQRDSYLIAKRESPTLSYTPSEGIHHALTKDSDWGHGHTSSWRTPFPFPSNTTWQPEVGISEEAAVAADGAAAIASLDEESQDEDDAEVDLLSRELDFRHELDFDTMATRTASPPAAELGNEVF
eukprot:SAG31_NODE_3436_length_4274_cov_4.308263_2_plen_129_part_00